MCGISVCYPAIVVRIEVNNFCKKHCWIAWRFRDIILAIANNVFCSSETHSTPRCTNLGSVNSPSPIQIMACRLIGAKPLSIPMPEYFDLNLRNKLQRILKQNSYFSFKKMHLKISSAKWRQFCRGLSLLMTKHYDWECLMERKFGACWRPNTVIC